MHLCAIAAITIGHWLLIIMVNGPNFRYYHGLCAPQDHGLGRPKTIDSVIYILIQSGVCDNTDNSDKYNWS